MKTAICTLGCKVNQYESEAIAEALESRGFENVPFDDAADIYIINTCAVTAESERKARQMIRRAVTKNPDAYIIVTGCSAQLSPDDIAAIGGIGYICGNREKMKVVEAAEKYRDGVSATETEKDTVLPAHCAFEPMTNIKSERTRAYIKIEDGCESNCAYCIIRKARGGIRSKPSEEIVAEARGLVASGYREIVLCGIEISAYGKDLDCGLCDLLEALDGIDGLDRVRLGSIDPAVMKPSFTDRLKKLKRIAPHFHLSLQSGCDGTLAAMRRRYNTKTVAEYVSYIRECIPDACFTADVIVGFPGESDGDFLTTCKFIESLGLLDFHIFTFSKRPGTEAASMSGQITKAVKSAREKELEKVRALSTARITEAFRGRTLPVLFEDYDGNKAFGHTANFLEVAVVSEKPLHNIMCDVLLADAVNGVIKGTII